MNIRLSQEHKAFVKRKVESGEDNSTGEVIAAAFRLLEAQDLLKTQ